MHDNHRKGAPGRENNFRVLLILVIVVLIPLVSIVNAMNIQALSSSVSVLTTQQEYLVKQNEHLQEKINEMIQLTAAKTPVETTPPVSSPTESTTEVLPTATEEPAQEAIIISKEVPNIDTSRKSYMDYRCITCWTQFEMQKQAWTDDNGFRRYGKAYMVAMGSYYGNVGDIFKITLSSGDVFFVIKGDEKANKDTDSLHMREKDSGNVLEFIVDTKKISKTSMLMGDMSYSGLSGPINKIEAVF